MKLLIILVEYDETGCEFLKESNLVDIIRNYFIYAGISTHFDIKKLKRIMKSKGINRTKENGEMEEYTIHAV